MNIAVPCCFSKIQKGVKVLIKGQSGHLQYRYWRGTALFSVLEKDSSSPSIGKGLLQSQHQDNMHFQCTLLLPSPLLVGAVWTPPKVPALCPPWTCLQISVSGHEDEGKENGPSSASSSVRAGAWENIFALQKMLFAVVFLPGTGFPVWVHRCRCLVGYKDIFLAGLHFRKKPGKCCIVQNSAGLRCADGL